MKNFLILIFLLTAFIGSEAKIKWEQISYFHSNGPVSPEYHYNYNIRINSDGSGVLEYTKKGKTNVFDFRVSRKGMIILNNALIKSRVLKLSSSELSSGKNLIGGSIYNATITMPFSEPTEEYLKREELKEKTGKKEEEETEDKTGEKKPIIIIPNNVNEKYAEGIFDFYQTIEKMVPSAVWADALK
ncbi:MAG: hypothetical protein JSS91_03035 [Bacteroidetes bacterium]|nr:hypothetical protein [Bacteroidota bacterium]